MLDKMEGGTVEDGTVHALVQRLGSQAEAYTQARLQQGSGQ